MTERHSMSLEEPDLTPGRGRGSGAASLALGVLAVLGALCFLFPDWLTTPEFRPLYDTALLRAVLYGGIAAGFCLGFFSVMRGGRWYGMAGLGLAVLAAVLGSMETDRVPVAGRSLYAGLDYFVLTLFLLALVFIPMERLFPADPAQRTLRRGWTTDLTYFFVSHVGIQLFSFFTVIPAQRFFSWLIDADLQRLVAAQPLWLQFLLILLVVDFVVYWLHRALHEVPALWQIHAVHHSSEQLDWLAASRIHFLELVATRLLGYLPVFLLGFAPAAVYAYLVFVSFHAIFIHANVRFRFPVLRWLIATPEFHRWHHSSEDAAVDRNYAGFLPLYDRLFGTAWLPPHPPARFGTRGAPLPEGFLGQLLHPFRQWRATRR